MKAVLAAASVGIVIGLLLPLFLPFAFQAVYGPVYRNFTVDLFIHKNGELVIHKQGDLMTVQLGWLFSQLLRDKTNGTQEQGVTPRSLSGSSLANIDYIKRDSTTFTYIYYTSTDSIPSINDYSLPGTATQLDVTGAADIETVLWAQGNNIKINVTVQRTFSTSDTIATLYLVVTFNDSDTTSKTVLVAKDDITPNISVNPGDTVRVTYVFTLQN